MIDDRILETAISAGGSDKSFVGKILAEKEVNRIKELMRKDKLERADLMELLNMLSSNESKLLNYGAFDRYHINKFFVWVREIVNITEKFYDYVDDMNAWENICITCNKKIDGEDKCKCKTEDSFIHQNALINLYNLQGYILNKYKGEPFKKLDMYPIQKKKISMTKTSKQMFLNTHRYVEHAVKFIVDLFLQISRSTLSLGATGILEVLKNKYELAYTQPNDSRITSDKNKLGYG